MSTGIESRFSQEQKDPGFLAAKGHFKVSLQTDQIEASRKRDDMLTRQHLAGDDPSVIGLTQQINDLEQQIHQEQELLERKHIKKLAGAIFMSVSKHKYANIRAIGDRAVYNAVRACEIASGYCNKEDITILVDIKKSEGNMGSLRSSRHVQNVTAYVFNIKVKEEK